jgi:ferrous iron transport protein B
MSHCAAAPGPPRPAAGPDAGAAVPSRRRIAIVGMPNTGKSTFFNRLTGARARIGNWPGVTVELLSARVILGGETVEVVDLPGVYDLHGYSDDERVVRHFFEQNPVNLVVVIASATQLDRQLALPLQLRDLGLPMVVLLNMQDEAQKLGIEVDAGVLARDLGVPVVLMSAKYGLGCANASRALEQGLRGSELRRANPGALAADDSLEAQLDRLVQRAVRVPVQFPEDLTARLDRVLLHPWLGLPLFFGAMWLVFEAVYTLGTPLQDGVASGLEWLKSIAIEPGLTGVAPALRSFLVDGVYDGLGTVLSFVPLLVLFFLFLGVVEDTGYLARAAFLMDAFMARLGLDGRSFVMQLMGFGCNVPALMGTRVMRSRGLRLLTMLTIPFSLCSARLQVFVFLTTAIFSPRAAPLVLFSLYLLSFAMAFLTAALYRRRLVNDEPLLLELPPYRAPGLRQMGLRAWIEVSHFLRKATGFIVLGVVLVWLLTHYPFDVEPAGPETVAGHLADWAQPLFAPLGFDSLLSVSLLFGFVAKEIVLGAMAVIYGAGEGALSGLVAHRLDPIQAYSFMLFVLLYTPCLSTVAVLKQESRSWRFTALAVAWPLAVAWLASFGFYQVATAVLR